MSAGASAEPLLRLRPLSLGEILDDVFRIYRRHFWLLVAITLVVALPAYLVQLAAGQADQMGLALTVLGNLGNPESISDLQSPAPPNAGLLGVTYVVMILLAPFTYAAIPRAAIDVVHGVPASVRSALVGVGRRYWGVMGLLLLYLVLLPLLICLPVGVWLFVRWIVAIPVLLAEGVGPIQALDRSWVLTRDNWWRLFGILLLIWLLTSVVSGALTAFAFPVAIVIPFIPPVLRGAIVLTMITAAGAVVQPALYLCLTLLYFDLRIRREDFDLDQLARQAVGPAT